MGMMCGELPAEDVAAVTDAVHRWEKDGRNHRFERGQFTSGQAAAWPKCTRGVAIPQRTCFLDELSPELGDDRDRTNDCRPCFSDGPPAPRKRAW